MVKQETATAAENPQRARRRGALSADIVKCLRAVVHPDSVDLVKARCLNNTPSRLRFS